MLSARLCGKEFKLILEILSDLEDSETDSEPLISVVFSTHCRAISGSEIFDDFSSWFESLHEESF